MQPTRLRALKPLTYNTRRLLPGDVFEVKPRDSRVLVAIRKAEAVRDPVELAPPPPAVAEKIADAVAPAADLSAARAEYEQALGKRPFMGWDAATLREKMAAARLSTDN